MVGFGEAGKVVSLLRQQRNGKKLQNSIRTKKNGLKDGRQIAEKPGAASGLKIGAKKGWFG